VGRVVGGGGRNCWIFFGSQCVPTKFSLCSQHVPQVHNLSPYMFPIASDFVQSFMGFSKFHDKQSPLTPSWATIVSLGRWNDPYSKK
jgi:hypothetical protein